MTSVLLLMGHANGRPGFLAGLAGVSLLVLLLCLATLLLSDRLMRLLGVTGANVVGRVLGIVLAALAVQFVLDGMGGTGLLGR